MILKCKPYTLLLVLITYPVLAQQIIFNKFYPKPHGAKVYGIASYELESGNILSLARSGNGAYLLKTDPNGLVIREDSITDGQLPYQVLRRSDGNFMLAGAKNDSLFVMEIDSSGSIIWESLPGHYFPKWPYHWLPTVNMIEADSNRILVLMSPGQFHPEGFDGSKLLAFDQHGDLIWSRLYDLPFFGIDHAIDSGYILAGVDTIDNPSPQISPSPVAVLRKIDTEGLAIWTKGKDLKLGGKGVDVVALDSVYVLAAAVGVPFDGHDPTTALFEFDINGDTVNGSDLQLPSFQLESTPISLRKTSDGGFFISSNFSHCDYPPECNESSGTMSLALFSKQRSLRWQYSAVRTSNHWGANHISSTADNGYLFTGFSNYHLQYPVGPPVASDRGRLKLIRFDSLGNTSVDLKNSPGEDPSLGFFPNPANTSISISTAEKFSQVSIHDLLGNLIMYAQQSDHLDVSHIPNGLYTLRVKLKGSKKMIVHKILIQH